MKNPVKLGIPTMVALGMMTNLTLAYIVGPDGRRNYGESVPPHAVRAIPDGFIECNVIRTTWMYEDVGKKTISKVKKNEEVSLEVGLSNEKHVTGLESLMIMVWDG
jgi:hypothetical protein